MYPNRYIRVFKLKKMKNKTALAELIDDIDKSEVLDTFTKRIFIAFCVNKLPKEKQDLINAYDEGSIATVYDSYEDCYDVSPTKEEYFNQNFEQ